MSLPFTQEQRKTLQRWIVTALQICITGGVLYLLLQNPEKRAAFAEQLRSANWLWLALGIATYGVVEILAAWRWELLLHVQDIFLSRARLLKLLLIGVCFNFVIPGGTGGDVVKVFYLVKEAPGRGPAAILSVLIDRIVGLFSLIALAGGFIVLRWQWLNSTEETQSFVLTGLIILGGSGGFIVLAALLSGFGMVHRLPPRFPARARLAELAHALNLYGRAKKPVAGAFAVSVLCHLGYILVFYCGARALEAPGRQIPTLLEMCAILPIVNTIAALPISVGGLGVREGLFQIFLNQLAGVAEETALAISSIGFLLTAFWGLVGGVLYLFYRPTDHEKVTRIKAQITALENEVAAAAVAEETRPCPAQLPNAR